MKKPLVPPKPAPVSARCTERLKRDLCRAWRNPALRSLCLSCLACLVALAFVPEPALSQSTGPGVETEEVSFDRFQPGRTRFGRLEWMGGIEIDSDLPGFGGLSGLVLSDDGTRMVAVSDAGRWFTAGLVYRDGRLAGMQELRSGRMRDTRGQPIKGKRRGDAESVARYDGKFPGRLIVGFESYARARIYGFGSHGTKARARTFNLPKVVDRGPNNKELEAIGRFPPGSSFRGGVVAISENNLDAAGNIRGWIVGGPRRGGFAVRPVRDFMITDLAIVAPRGDLLTLERRFSPLTGVGMLIRWFPADTIRPGAILKGRVLIDVGQVHAIDNMEGLAVHRDRQGRLRLTVISDDNFNPLQRTIMHQFIWDEKS